MPTCYSPIRRSRPTSHPEGILEFSSLDLHVLGTPPAFVLSQDQTLILKMSLFNLLQIIACELTSLICLDSSKLEPAHCETLFSFQSTNRCLPFGDATFYILLACLILVNKFLIFSFCLRETCLSHAATNISILVIFERSNQPFHSLYILNTR